MRGFANRAKQTIMFRSMSTENQPPVRSKKHSRKKPPAAALLPKVDPNIGAPERQEWCTVLCEKLKHGGSLQKVCRETPGAPSPAKFLEWVGNDPNLGKQYSDARAIGYQHLADELLEIADTTEVGQTTTTKEWGTEVQRADMIKHRQLRIDTRKWLLSKMLPKVYGDKLSVEQKTSEGLANALASIAAKLPV